jgi:thymidine phosphorylase
MAEMEASILSRKSASGAGVISAPLPILSGALRHTVGEFARKLEHVHHEFEHKVGVKQG